MNYSYKHINKSNNVNYLLSEDLAPTSVKKWEKYIQVAKKMPQGAP